MADLKDKLSQPGNIVIYTKANGYFSVLNSKMAEAGKSQLTLKSAYASKYDIAEHLHKQLSDNYRTEAPKGVSVEGDFAPLAALLDKSKSIAEIAANNEDYTKLETYLNNCVTLAPGAFNPPLGEPFTSEGTIYPIPYTTELDARRFARVLYFEQPFDKSQITWLTNNAPLYGFIMYENYALYYIGFAEIKTKIGSIGVEKLVNQFQRDPIPAGNINLTAAAVLNAPDPIQPTIDKTPNGTMHFSNPSNPLLLVFGGIDVNGKPSGDYMPPYFDGIYDRYNVWIANSNRVPGKASYDEVMLYLSQKGWSGTKKILYCFSGGQSPGQKLITSGDINTFTQVYLVDIWMKNIDAWPNWVEKNASKASYFYTTYGPGGGPPAGVPQQDRIIAALGYPTPKTADTVHFENGGNAHMNTNKKAVATL